MDAATTVKAYKSLSQVEEAFRCYKSIDLKVRPIYHYQGDRVKAHIFLCMLAYYVEWHLKQCLAPLLFEDEESAQSKERKNGIKRISLCIVFGLCWKTWGQFA